MGLAERLKDFVGGPEEDDFEESYSDFEENSSSASIQAGVIMLYPRDFQQARAVVDRLLPRHIIVINLERIEQESLRRMVDFFAGIAYGIRGTFTRAARSTYIIIPPDVQFENQYEDWEQPDPLAL